ncbi:MAG: flavin reductase family protein [Actinomycetia bacterium]|nr:flavin reductase family protein [Actinomycetes bacterium]
MATFTLTDLAGIDRYKLLTGLIVPRPIGWIGTVDGDGVRNLAPYSFFNCVSATPPTVVVGTGHRAGSPKDTLSNLRDTGVFTVSIVTEEVVEAMNATSAEVPPDVDEFAEAGLTAVTGSTVHAPYVGEAKAALECEVNQIVPLGDPPTSWLVIGDVRTVHVDDDLLDGTRIDAQALKAIGRFAGAGYCTTVDGLFTLERPV